MKTEINKKSLKSYGFENKYCVEFDWEKRFRSTRQNEDGTYGESIFGLIRWGDGQWEVYITTAKIDGTSQSTSLIRLVESMEQIAKLYTAITDTKLMKVTI